MAQLVDRLTSFLKASADSCWQPGEVDCCMFLASWAMWLGHPDPARHLRNTYRSEDEFRAIIGAAGGVVPVVKKCVEMIAGRAVDVPAVGAIGVIGSSQNIERQWGAVFDGHRWLVRARTGIVAFTAKPLAIWEI